MLPIAHSTNCVGGACCVEWPPGKLCWWYLHTLGCVCVKWRTDFADLGGLRSAAFLTYATFLAKRALIFTCSLKQLPGTLSSPRGGDMSYQVLNEHFPSFLRFIKWVLFNEVSFSLKQMSSRKRPKSAAFAWAQRVKMIVPFLVWNAKSLERKTNMECDCSGERERTMRFHNFWW